MKLERDYGMLRHDHAVLIDDFARSLPRLRPAPVSSMDIRLSDYDTALDMVQAVSFEDLRILTRIRPYDLRKEGIKLRPYTIQVMREQAAQLARLHADEVERKIFETSLAQFNAKEASRERQGL